MNNLIIPPCPNWYETNIIACALDNTVVYGSRGDVVVIYPKPPEEPADIKIFRRLHRDKVLGVLCCPQWGSSNKLVATYGEDKIVYLLDLDTFCKKTHHSGHKTQSDKLVGATFAGNDKIISVSENGYVIVWRWANNQLHSVENLLNAKNNKVTCISSCPHATWLVAFGLKKGDIAVADLRKSGRIVHRLRGNYDRPVCALAWCPVPYNVFPRKLKLMKENGDSNADEEASENFEESAKSLGATAEQSADEQQNSDTKGSIAEAEGGSEGKEDDVDVIKATKSHEDSDNQECSNADNIKGEIIVQIKKEVDQTEMKRAIQNVDTEKNESCVEKNPVENLLELKPTMKEVDTENKESCIENVLDQPEIKRKIKGIDTENKESCIEKKSVKNVLNQPELKPEIKNVYKECCVEKDSAQNVVDQPKVKPGIKCVETENRESYVEKDSAQNVLDELEIKLRINCVDTENKESCAGKDSAQNVLDELDIKLRINCVDTENKESCAEKDSHENVLGQSERKPEDVETENKECCVEKNLGENVLAQREIKCVETENKEPCVEKYSRDNILGQTEIKPEHIETKNKECCVKKNSAENVLAQPEIICVKTENKESCVEKNLRENILVQPEIKLEDVEAENEESCVKKNSVENVIAEFKEEEKPEKIASQSEAEITNGSEKKGPTPIEGDSSEVKEDVADEEEEEDLTLQREYLLATASRGGRIIHIWRVGTNGSRQVELYLPLKQHKGKKRHNEDSSWIALCWITPKNLLSSSPKGELLQWNFSYPNNKGNYKYRVIHGDHHQNIFGIAAPVKESDIFTLEGWRGKEFLHAWTTGKDRFILNTSLCTERKTIASYQTFIGGIYCMASSDILPSKIAIGGGEGSCRLWDLSHPHSQYIGMTQFSDRTHARITSVAWHPTKENILAVGRSDGKIGLVDPCNCSKSPIFLVRQSDNTVFKVEWGPLNGNQNNLGLYAVTAEKLFVYDASNALQEPIQLISKTAGIWQISWKFDGSLCAVGTKEGHVLIFSFDFQPLSTFYMQEKSVRWLSWHPEATVEDDSISPYSCWLAVASNDVIVYDCSDLNSSEQSLSKRVVAVFKNHIKPISCLSWSNFEGGKLASAGEDGAALVWDVPTKTLISSCISSIEDEFNCVLWSPVNADCVITAAKSNIVQIWKVSENPPRTLKINKKMNTNRSKLTELKKQNDEEEEEDEKADKSKKKKYVLGALLDRYCGDPEYELAHTKKLYALRYKKECRELVNDGEEEDVDVDPLRIFGDEKDLAAALHREMKQLVSKKKVQNSDQHILLWQGDVAAAIRTAINTKTLSPWLVSMAPTVCHNLYLEACETYAQQLSEETRSNPYEITSYYLACHKVEKAIETLCFANLYMEALALAKLRLVLTDPVITTILERWAQYSAEVGHYEIASQCYIALDRLEDAAKILFKRSHEVALEFCAELAKEYCSKDFLDAVLYKLDCIKNPQVDVEVEANASLPTRADLQIMLKGELNAESEEAKQVINGAEISSDSLEI